MQTQGKVQFFECGPQGIIVLVVPILSVEKVGAHESRLEAQFLGAAAGFFDRFIDSEWRDHGGTVESLRIFTAEFVEPIVVSPGNGRRETPLHVRFRQRNEYPRGVQDGDIDSVNIHGLELYFGWPSMVVVASIERFSALKIFAAVRRTTTVISRWVVSPVLPVGVDHSKLPQVTAGETNGSERFELGLDMTLPEIGWLHN